MKFTLAVYIGLMLAAAAAACCNKADDARPRVVCYYATWAYDYAGEGAFQVSNINATLCTHVIYSFVDISLEGDVLLTDESFDIGQKGLADFAALRDENANLVTMVAVGGWNAASTNFSTVAANATLRQTFASKVVAFLEKYKLCGFDLDWEYPSDRGNVTSNDKENFVLLVQDLRSAFTSSSKGYTLSAAVAATQARIDTAYDVPSLNDLLDFINIMTYDLHGTWDGVTGANAPLYPQPTDAADTVLTVNASVQAWISNGASPSKLNVGLGTYGQAYTLASASNNATGAPSTLDAASLYYSPYVNITSTWNYNEICIDQYTNPGNWTVRNVNDSFVYAIKDLLWIGYDNADTMSAKGAYAKSQGLGGLMFWALHGDDFKGNCGGGNYPLINAAVNGYNKA